MAIRFFKKMGGNPVNLSTGAQCKFTSLDGGLSAYFATDSPGVAAEFEQIMREGRYALTEIDAATFTRDYVEKKSGAILKPVWREELTPGSMRASESTFKARLEAAASVVGVGKPEVPPPPPAAVTAREITPEVAKDLKVPTPPVEEFKPIVGKRRGRPPNAKP